MIRTKAIIQSKRLKKGPKSNFLCSWISKLRILRNSGPCCKYGPVYFSDSAKFTEIKPKSMETNPNLSVHSLDTTTLPPPINCCYKPKFQKSQWDEKSSKNYLPCVSGSPPMILMPNLLISRTQHSYKYQIWRTIQIFVPPTAQPFLLASWGLRAVVHGRSLWRQVVTASTRLAGWSAASHSFPRTNWQTAGWLGGCLASGDESQCYKHGSATFE